MRRHLAASSDWSTATSLVLNGDGGSKGLSRGGRGGGWIEHRDPGSIRHQRGFNWTAVRSASQWNLLPGYLIAPRRHTGHTQARKEDEATSKLLGSWKTLRLVRSVRSRCHESWRSRSSSAAAFVRGSSATDLFAVEFDAEFWIERLSRFLVYHVIRQLTGYQPDLRPSSTFHSRVSIWRQDILVSTLYRLVQYTPDGTNLLNGPCYVRLERTCL